MTAVSAFAWVGVFAFLGAVIYTFVIVGQFASGDDSKKEVAKSIGNILIINFILVLVLAGTAYFYVAAEPLAERPYIMIMLHASLLISIMSVSISSMQQLNAASPPS